ncbi:MAG: phage/plasmid primase, P4 family [Formivibrio sp.]|nr:phage/plasmid primase, P4 family [Formivibrio sp.]
MPKKRATPLPMDLASPRIIPSTRKVVSPVNLAEVKEFALLHIDAVLEHYLTDGEYKGKEYVAFNPTRSDCELGSFSVNALTGIWADFATDDKGDILDLIVYLKQDDGFTVYDAARELLGLIKQWEGESDYADRKGHAAAKRELAAATVSEWTPMFPVPEDAPPPPAMHYQLGTPSMRWAYNDAVGKLLGFICRFDVNGKKEIRPLTYWRSADGKLEWRWQGFSGPRPFYGLDRLAANPDAMVIVVEGEKAADAAQKLLPDYVAVTTMHGAQSPEKSDFSPLAGRKIVVIWPDNDSAGMGYAEKVTSLIHAVDPNIQILVLPPITQRADVDGDGASIFTPGYAPPPGWDAADALADGWTPAHAKLLIMSAQQAAVQTIPIVTAGTELAEYQTREPLSTLLQNSQRIDLSQYPLGQALPKGVCPKEMFAADGIHFVTDRCHLMRKYSHPDYQNDVPEPIRHVMMATLSMLNSGREFAHEASKHLTNYTVQETDGLLVRNFDDVAILTCEYARENGWQHCPKGRNCLQPSGQPVSAPIQLANWSVAEMAMKKVPESVLAQSFVDRYHPQGLVYSQASFWGYQEGVYRLLHQGPDVDKNLAYQFGLGGSISLINNTVGMLQAHVAQHADIFTSHKHLLCVTNGTFNLTTGELEAHSPDHMLRNKVDILFDPSAECLKFLEFLDEVFGPDADKAEKIAFLRQWLGYLLIPDTSYQKMVWLVGAGGNGKSVLLQVVECLVGSENISHVMLDRLGTPAVRAELVGKTLNISADLPKDTMINDGYIKAIVAGDPIDAEPKFKQPFSFKPHVRLMAAMNNLPRTNDTSDGFFRRTVILMFNRKFTESEQNPRLAEELREELPGILNWALAGLADLRLKNGFTIPPSSMSALSTYRVESNPVQLFAEGCLTACDSGGYVATELYEIYMSWASARGFKRQSIITFGRALSDLGFSKRRSAGREYWLVNLTAEGQEVKSLADNSRRPVTNASQASIATGYTL